MYDVQFLLLKIQFLFKMYLIFNLGINISWS